MLRWPIYDEEQIADVAEVLRSGKVNQWTGPHVQAFEKAYAEHLGLPYCVALANGTMALELALKVLALAPGDEVIVTPRSFMASASCVHVMGGTAVFADVDLDSQNITAETIAQKISPRTRGIIVVHLAGWPCDMDAICALAKARGLWLVEDCAQAHGATYNGKPVGTFGDLAAFSFCQDKIITTGGEGGLLAMRDERLWKAAWSYKDHGKSYDTVFHKEHAPGFRWLHEQFGTNWRMMSVQAVLGLRQLQRLPGWHEARSRNAEILLSTLRNLGALRSPEPEANIRHAWYRFYTFVRPNKLKREWSRDRIVSEIVARGVPCFTGSCSEIYLEKAFTHFGSGPAERLPNARQLGETSIALLVDPCLDTADMKKTAEAVRDVVLGASLD